MIFDIPEAVPSSSRLIIVPQPSNEDPSSENPSTVVSLNEIINPASSAAPPDALSMVAPSILNWKPATGSKVLYSTDPSAAT